MTARTGQRRPWRPAESWHAQGYEHAMRTVLQVANESAERIGPGPGHCAVTLAEVVTLAQFVIEVGVAEEYFPGPLPPGGAR